MSAATRALGYPVGQQKLAKLAGTSEGDGTSEDGIRRALLASGFIPEVHSSNLRWGARNWLLVKLRLGYPVILAVGRQRWEHWVVAVGMIGLRFVIFDPAKYQYNVNSGVQFRDWKKLAEHWYANKKVRGKDGAYYGISVMKGES